MEILHSLVWYETNRGVDTRSIARQLHSSCGETQARTYPQVYLKPILFWLLML